jgi:hypothetical protein
MEHSKPLNSAQKGAQKYFTKTAQDDTLAKEVRKKERSATAAKTAKLRALRLAKEATDKEAADQLAAQNTGAIPAARRKRVAAVKPVRMLRLSY